MKLGFPLNKQICDSNVAYVSPKTIRTSFDTFGAENIYTLSILINLAFYVMKFLHIQKFCILNTYIQNVEDSFQIRYLQTSYPSVGALGPKGAIGSAGIKGGEGVKGQMGVRGMTKHRNRNIRKL